MLSFHPCAVFGDVGFWGCGEGLEDFAVGAKGVVWGLLGEMGSLGRGKVAYCIALF